MRLRRGAAQRARIGVAVALLTVAAIGLTACGTSGSGSAGATGGSGDTITLYNGQHEQTTAALVKAFTAATGIKVNVRSDDETVLAQQMEKRVGRHGRTFSTPRIRPHSRNSPARACWHRSTRTRSPPYRRSSAHRPATGWGSRRALACSSTTPTRSRRRSSPSRSWIWLTRSGGARSPSHPARPTSSRS